MAFDPPAASVPAPKRRFLFVKLAAIAAIIVFLHVPLIMMHGVLQERRNYQVKAVEEIANVWGREQRVTGPVLAVPYSYWSAPVKTMASNGRVAPVEEAKLVAGTAYFLPEELRVEVSADPETRHRGIYEAVVYSSRLKFSGRFRPDFKSAGIEGERIHWERARVLFGLSDLHGLRQIGMTQPAGAFEAADADEAAGLALAARVSSVGSDAVLEFAFDAVVQGSGALLLPPLGKTTSVTMRSTWRDPSFTGAWLPTARTVNNEGFTAEWKVAHFARGFPQAWTTRSVSAADVMPKIQAAAFGVRFARGIDSYGFVERAQKYGVLFFALTFAVYFLFEVMAGLRIHPLQYTMVGAALCLFFLGFLALSEFWPTATAYGVSAAACTALVTLYSWSFLHSGARTLLVCAGLAATYGYLYFVLKSQDYALLAGTAALFAVLAVIMFCTRRINWFALEQPVAVK